jgi:hypothetical protein
MKLLDIPNRFKIPDDNKILLRAMIDLYSIDLLETGEIYFSRTDNPKHGINAEAVLSIADIKYIREKHKSRGLSDWEKFAEKEIDDIRKMRSYTYISCWNISQMETRFVWNTYGKIKNSCTFKSSVSKLKQSLLIAEEPYKFVILEVSYIDPISGSGGFGNTIGLFSNKFDFDRQDEEARALIQLDNNLNPPKHLRIKVDLNILLESVIINQLADIPFIEKINSLCEIRNIQCHKSRILSY